MAVVGNLTITQLLVLQMKAQATLKEAIRNERSKRWEQVVKNYIDLLKLLSRKRFPDDWKSPGWYSLLMYETHYHLGLAFQRLDRHKRAVHHYTKSIDAISIPKNGCAAKCNSNSCLSTPVFAKRAFGNAKIGELKSSLKDAEKTVVLDSKNPDGFCIRALVHSTRGERKLALGDVDAALLLNPNHACALVIRGTLDKSAMEEASDHAGGKQNYVHPDHLKACLVKPDAQNYLDVGDFKHPRILDFYDRFLYSLNVPHTVCDYHVSLLPPQFWYLLKTVTRGNTAKPESALPLHSTKGTLRPGTKQTIRSGCRHTDADTTAYVSPKPPALSSSSRPSFRVGTPFQYVESVSSVDRRTAYDKALQQARRAKSAPLMRPMIAALGPRDIKKERVLSAASSRQRPVSAATTSYSRTQMSYETINVTPKLYKDSHHLSSIRVMEKVNVKYAPRMYIKAWSGDKIPPADIDKRPNNFMTPHGFICVGPYQ